MQLSLALCALVAQRIVIPAPPIPLVPDRELIVEAGKFDRENTVVRVDLLERDAKRNLVLTDEHGKRVAFQVDARGRAYFIVSMKKGTSVTYRLAEQRTPPVALKSRVTVDAKNPGVYRLLVDGRRALEFQGQPKQPRTDVPLGLVRAGFIDPLYTPAGVVLTEAYPKDEPHHLGIWSFWKTIEVENNKVDFWDAGSTGRIQMESKGPAVEGPVFGGFESRLDYVGLKGFKGMTLLHETWRVLAYPTTTAGKAKYFLVDLESEQTAAKPTIVSRGDMGGIAVRGRVEWAKGKGGLQRLSSEGTPSPEHARWFYMGGQQKGEIAGIAILGDPSNLGAPQALNKAESPEERPVAGFVPNAEKAVAFNPPAPLSFRYRFVALDGKPDSKLIERLWTDFAFPPTVEVRVAQSSKK